jgi:hypothetical protein
MPDPTSVTYAQVEWIKPPAVTMLPVACGARWYASYQVAGDHSWHDCAIRDEHESHRCLCGYTRPEGAPDD